MLGGEDDLALIAYIIRDDVELPIYPIWDEKGLILDQVNNNLPTGVTAYGATRSFAEFMGLQSRATKRGLFNPRKWGVGDDQDAKLIYQREVKKMILRRLFPGLREQTDEFLTSFIRNFSPVKISTAGGAGTDLDTKTSVFDMTQLAGGIVDYNPLA